MSDEAVIWLCVSGYAVVFVFYAAYLARIWSHEHLAILAAAIWPIVLPFHLASKIWKWLDV